MTLQDPRPVLAADTRRHVGYAIGAAVNGALLYVVNVAPGWEAVPFLTDRFPEVLGVVNLSFVAGFVVNVVYGAYDPRWFRDVGEFVTTGIGLLVLLTLLQVFPFAFDDPAVNWAGILRIVLAVGVLGCALGLLGQLAVLVRDVLPVRHVHR